MNFMTVNPLIYYIVLVLILLYLAEYYAASSVRNLTSSGWVLFYSPGCSFCDKQLKSMGGQSKWLKKVNCKKSTNLCEDNNINAYPTWLNTKTGKRYEGYIEKDDLVETLNNTKGT